MEPEEGVPPGTSSESHEAPQAAASLASLTAGTPSRVKVIFEPTQTIPRFAAGPSSLVEFRGRLAFAVNRENGARELWTSDGTEAGTVALKRFPPDPPPAFNVQVANLTPVGERLFFTVGDPAYGNELWVSDGTASGTRLVADLSPGPEGSRLTSLTALGGALTFFREVPGTDTTPARAEVWRSDGTATGTVRVLDLGSGTEVDSRTARAGTALVFFVRDTAGNTVAWRTDGTPAGTQSLRALSGPEGYAPLEVNSRSGLAFFTSFDAQGATTVWKSDGTRAGTVRLYTFVADGRYPRLMTTLGAYLYVTLSNPADQRMAIFRLRLDGVGGKEHVATLSNPYASQPEAFPTLNTFSATADRLYFEQVIGSGGPAPRDTQLWVTDGTKAGTRLLHRPLSLSDEYGSPIFAVESGLAFFAGYDDTFGIETWVTDGTVAGTRRLKDIAPGGGSSYPYGYTRVGATVFFSAFDDTSANQLWKVPLLPGP
ncbi:ELWxxDGT repeat protein [Pyxidicoccus sp. 3LFB2]